MTTRNVFEMDIDGALAEDIAHAAMGHLSRATLAYDDGSAGHVAGCVYFDDATRRYYAADVDALRRYVEVLQRDGRESDCYSVWCSETSSGDGYDTEEDAMEAEGWMDSATWTDVYRT